MKIWALMSNVDDILEKQGEAAFKQFPGISEPVLIDYLDVKIGTDQETEFYYKGQKLELPDAFWPMLSNTDAFVIENLLLNSGVKSLINMDEVAVARSKIATYQRLAQNGVRVPETIAFFNHPDKNSILEKFNYPFVMKPDNGFGGEGVALIHNEEELDAYLKNLKYGIAYMAQEYISTSRGKDLRVIFLNGEIIRASVRSAQDPNEFRSNIHVGGKYLSYELDEKTKQLCEKVAGLFDLPMIGLDLMFGEDEFVFAEVNAFPGLTTILHKLTEAEQIIIKKFQEKNGGDK